MSEGIFIYGNVPSAKNSKVWTGKYLICSKNVYKYKYNAAKQFLAHRNRFIRASENKSLPIHVRFTFFRDTEQRFDFNNISQVLCDLMVTCGWIQDDSYKYLVPVFNPIVHIDKKNPGVRIEVL